MGAAHLERQWREEGGSGGDRLFPICSPKLRREGRQGRSVWTADGASKYRKGKIGAYGAKEGEDEVSQESAAQELGDLEFGLLEEDTAMRRRTDRCVFSRVVCPRGGHDEVGRVSPWPHMRRRRGSVLELLGSVVPRKSWAELMEKDSAHFRRVAARAPSGPARQAAPDISIFQTVAEMQERARRSLAMLQGGTTVERR